MLFECIIEKKINETIINKGVSIDEAIETEGYILGYWGKRYGLLLTREKRAASETAYSP